MFSFIKSLFKRPTSGVGPERDTKNSHVPKSLQNTYEENLDIIKGFKFLAVLNPTTPLQYLESDGVFKEKLSDEDISIPGRFGCFIPQVKDKFRIPITNQTRASFIGPVPLDGGDILPALKKIRAIVEADYDEKKSLFIALDRSQKIQKLPYSILGGEYCTLFIIEEMFQKKIPYLKEEHYRKILDSGIEAIQEIHLTDKNVILGMKGIGPKKMDAIFTKITE